MGKTFTIKEFTVTISDDGVIQIGGAVVIDTAQPIPAEPIQPTPTIPTQPETPAPTPVEPTVTISVGDKVRVRRGAVAHGTNQSLAEMVYTNVYEVIQRSGNRVVIGINGAVTAAVNISDLILAR